MKPYIGHTVLNFDKDAGVPTPATVIYVNANGTVLVKDHSKDFQEYVRYLEKISGDKKAFCVPLPWNGSTESDGLVASLRANLEQKRKTILQLQAELDSEKLANENCRVEIEELRDSVDRNRNLADVYLLSANDSKFALESAEAERNKTAAELAECQARCDRAVADLLHGWVADV